MAAAGGDAWRPGGLHRVATGRARKPRLRCEMKLKPKTDMALPQLMAKCGISRRAHLSAAATY